MRYIFYFWNIHVSARHNISDWPHTRKSIHKGKDYTKWIQINLFLNWQNFRFTPHAFCLQHATQSFYFSNPQPTVTLTFCILVSSFCKFPEYNFKITFCSTLTVFCDPGKQHEGQPVEYYESSPELVTISGTGNTFRSHNQANAAWTDNTDTVSIHQTQRTDVFSGCAPLHPSCHENPHLSGVCTACSYLMLPDFNVNTVMANRTHTQIPQFKKNNKKTPKCLTEMGNYKCF